MAGSDNALVAAARVAAACLRVCFMAGIISSEKGMVKGFGNRNHGYLKFAKAQIFFEICKILPFAKFRFMLCRKTYQA